MSPRTAAPRRTAGFTLVECLVALLILSIGLVGAAGLQALLAKSSAGGDVRLRAAALANELHGRMVGDYNNLGCYLYPVSNCSATASSSSAAMSDWVTAVQKLPGGLAPVVSQSANGLWTIRIRWQQPQDSTANSQGASPVSVYTLSFKVDTAL